ncbi:MAG: hypothetical protein AAF590_10840 [Pseudomonadota bacterium]
MEDWASGAWALEDRGCEDLGCEDRGCEDLDLADDARLRRGDVLAAGVLVASVLVADVSGASVLSVLLASPVVLRALDRATDGFAVRRRLGDLGFVFASSAAPSTPVPASVLLSESVFPSVSATALEGLCAPASLADVILGLLSIAEAIPLGGLSHGDWSHDDW